MKIDPNIINKTFCDLGFKYHDKYHGFDPSYSKDGVEFRIYSNYISIAKVKLG